MHNDAGGYKNKASLTKSSSASITGLKPHLQVCPEGSNWAFFSVKYGPVHVQLKLLLTLLRASVFFFRVICHAHFMTSQWNQVAVE